MDCYKESAKIRRVSPDDADEFLKLEAKCFNMRLSQNTKYYWKPIVSYQWVYKAVSQSKIVGGIIAMATRDEDLLYINSLFVHQAYRNKGIATKLLKKVLKIAEKRRVVLDLRTDRSFLVEFYEKFGFRIKKLRKDYYGDGTDIYLLERAKN